MCFTAPPAPPASPSRLQALFVNHEREAEQELVQASKGLVLGPFWMRDGGGMIIFSGWFVLVAGWVVEPCLGLVCLGLVFRWELGVLWVCLRLGFRKSGKKASDLAGAYEFNIRLEHFLAMVSQRLALHSQLVPSGPATNPAPFFA